VSDVKPALKQYVIEGRELLVARLAVLESTSEGLLPALPQHAMLIHVSEFQRSSLKWALGIACDELIRQLSEVPRADSTRAQDE
jgi:hypothetical protein